MAKRSPASTAGILVGALLAAGLFGGVARASSLTATSSAHPVTAAQDQYGEEHIIPPAKPHVFTPPKVHAPSTKPAPAAAPAAATTAAAPTPAATAAAPTPATTAAAPQASTASTLPYTGLALLKVVLVGLGLLALGFALRRWPSRSRNGPRA